jgi:guanylate kinase
MPPQSIEVAKRLNRGSKTKAKSHQRLSQKSGWVMADKSLDKTNINNLNQNVTHRTQWLLFIDIKAWLAHGAIGFVL